MANPNRNTNTWMTDTGSAGNRKTTNSSGNTKVLNTPKYRNAPATNTSNTGRLPGAYQAVANYFNNYSTGQALKNLATENLKKIATKADTGGNNGGGGNGKGGNGTGNYGRYRSYYSGGSGGGGYAVAGDTNNLAAMAAALEAQKQARLDAINAANAALDQQAAAMKGKYDTSLQTLANDYQQLRNAAEVNRYRAQYNQREALANRGALDSGAGRQEALALQNNYNNNLNTINTQEAAERAAIQNAINEMYAQVEQQKASNMTSGLNDYNSALQSLINAEYSGYTPEMSNYYQMAANALGGNGLYQKYLQSLGYNV